MAEHPLLNLQELSPFAACKDITTAYEKLELLGEGTYGQVFRALDRATGELVALKRIKTLSHDKDGAPPWLIREIKLLKKLPPHPNIIQLKEVFTSFDAPISESDERSNVVSVEPPTLDLEEGEIPASMEFQQPHALCKQAIGHYSMKSGSIYLVFECMDHDISRLLKAGVKLTLPQVKSYMQQLLAGLKFLQDHGVLHRDIKCANLLINKKGVLKIADFGLARELVTGDMTPHVVTRWYRPPELLLGCTQYGSPVDMWSVGCIFGELLKGQAILQGKNDMDQIKKICTLCGFPREATWPGVTELPMYKRLKVNEGMRRKIGMVFEHLEMDGLELIGKMLTLNPDRRITAGEALQSKWFSREPLPSPYIYETLHVPRELDEKKHKQKQGLCQGERFWQQQHQHQHQQRWITQRGQQQLHQQRQPQQQQQLWSTKQQQQQLHQQQKSQQHSQQKQTPWEGQQRPEYVLAEQQSHGQSLPQTLRYELRHSLTQPPWQQTGNISEQQWQPLKHERQSGQSRQKHPQPDHGIPSHEPHQQSELTLQHPLPLQPPDQCQRHPPPQPMQQHQWQALKQQPPLQPPEQCQHHQRPQPMEQRQWLALKQQPQRQWQPVRRHRQPPP